MDMAEKVLEIVRQKGPLLPAQLSKEINKDLLMSSAMLAELVSNKKIKYSCAKIGSSPLYYVPNQAPKLQSLFNHLHEKEQSAFNLLKQKKILRDKKLSLLTRVALRQIKDFAVPLEINLHGNIELIWKWYLISNNEVNSLLKYSLKKHNQSQQKTQQKQQPIPDTTPLIQQKPITEPIQEKIKTNINQPIINKDNLKENLQNQLGEELLKELKEKLRREILAENKELQDLKKETESSVQKEEENDPLLMIVKSYLGKINIKILSYNILKKNKEIELTVKIPSSIGDMIYYCLVKGKKKINNSDISVAYTQCQQKKLPLLLLSTGELSKKTKEALNNEFKGISFKKIN